MAILNGFLRGVHDKEITANVDNKEYSGVATEMYNFIGSKRGGMSKRQPFLYRQTLDSGTYIIPYVYSADQKYLLRFVPRDDGTTSIKMLAYNGGSLQEFTPEYAPSIRQPEFTSNNQDEYVVSQSSGLTGEAYKRFNANTVVHANYEKTGQWVQIQYPAPVKLYKLSIYNRIAQDSSEVIINFTVQGSNDGTTWTTLPHKTSEISNTHYTIKSFEPTEAYKWFRFTTTSATTKGKSSSAGWYLFSNSSSFCQIQLTVQETNVGPEAFSAPYSIAQVKELHWVNENKRIVFCHKEHVPYELNEIFRILSQNGLNFATLGNPQFACFYQERLGFGGFTKAVRQFNLSKSNPSDATTFDFTLPTSEIKSTDAMQFVIRSAKYPLRESLAGRNMIYLQCIDGLATVSSGGDEVPLTPTQVSANLRNHTPFSDIPAVYQEELAFLVGADYKTVYAMDFDYNVMRVRTVPINEHCLSYFSAGIAQMITVRGKVPYLVFRLTNGKIIVAMAYRTETRFYFHAFPIETTGNITCIASLLNDVTGFDTLFAVVELPNGTTVLESLESASDEYSVDLGRQYFMDNIALDCRQKLSAEVVSDDRFSYQGTISSIGRVLFESNKDDNSDIDLSGKEIKLYFSDREVICKNCEWNAERNGFWAEASSEPAIGDNIYAYAIPQKTWHTPMYQGLDNVQVFNGDDFIDLDAKSLAAITLYGWVYDNDKPFKKMWTISDNPQPGDACLDETGNVLEIDGVQWIVRRNELLVDRLIISPEDGTAMAEYTFMRSESDDIHPEENVILSQAIYDGVFGLTYTARAEFENLTDALSVPYEKEIDNISACITYATGVKLGTESVLEKIGYWDYKFEDWQDRILPDENLKNIPLADTARKDKKIVLECDYPFPANITFIVYDLKITGVR